MKYILASASPRRRELLTQMGLTFTVIPSNAEEVIGTDSPEHIVMDLAKQKAQEVAGRVTEEAIIIGSDTVVVYEGQILGKPKDEADAIRMLRSLSDHTHQVYTGVCLIKKSEGQEQIHTFFDETKVTFYPMTDSEIQSYVDSKDPMDKAGAYGIQGSCAKFIKGIQGDYNNVVGLPIARLYHELQLL